MLIQHRNTKRIREVDDRKGQRLVRQGFATAYQTREIRAAEPVVQAVVVADPEAPFGRKADGTPRLRPAYNVKK